MKFKVGNRAKVAKIICECEDEKEKIQLEKCLNQSGGIIKIDNDSYPYLITFDNSELEEEIYWREEELELVDIEDTEEYKVGYTKGFSDGVNAVTNAKVYEDQSFEDEIGGIHDEGTGWNPYGVWCGECGNLTCVGCPSANKGENEE